jgi:hypothetical protein
VRWGDVWGDVWGVDGGCGEGGGGEKRVGGELVWFLYRG